MSSFPPLRKLHYVLAVARELHFRKAAERLNLSQPSLSRRVRELESELGFEIFRRDHHFVETTEAGEAFLADVEQILPRLQADFQRARDHARNISRQDSALFIIGHSPFVPTGFRRQIRSIQRRKFAYLNLQFRTVFAPELAESIASGTYHAGVTFAPLEGYGHPTNTDRLRSPLRCRESEFIVNRKPRGGSPGLKVVIH